MKLTPFTISAIFLSLAAHSATAVPPTPHGDQHIPPVTRTSIARSYAAVPLSFEVNQGQTDSRVKFLGRGAGYSLFLTPSETVLTLRHTKPRKARRGIRPMETNAVLRMHLLHSNPTPGIHGEDGLSGKANYLIGNDPARWRTRIPTYGKVRYTGVYKGIDLVYYGNQNQLEYDFIVAPQADPGSIAFGFAGAQPHLNTDGSLALRSPSGEIRWHRPVIYQQIAGVRTQIAGRFAAIHHNQIGFTVGSYDHTRPLIIDPVVSYATYLAGSNVDEGRAIAVDNTGAAYVTGDTDSPNFPTTAGSFQTTLPKLNTPTIFVTKLTPDGSAVVYSTYIGGTSSSYADSIAIDSIGNAYITGGTDCANFPVTPGCYQNSPQVPYGNNFWAKLSADGSTLLYSTYLLGGNENGSAIRVDASGTVYVAGQAQNANFLTTANAFQKTLHGVDIFLIKFVPNGTHFTAVYSTFFGNDSDNSTDAIAVDNAGHVVMTGATDSANFPLKNAAQTTVAAAYHAFVAKFDTTQSGNASLVFSTYLASPSPGAENVTAATGGIGQDPQGNIYVAGETDSPNFPVTAGTFQTTFGGGFTDAFVAKYSSLGKKLAATYLGGPGSDAALDVGVDNFGNVYVSGETSPGFPQMNSVQPTSVVTVQPAFVSVLDTNLQHLLFSTVYGGQSSEFGYGIAVSPDGSAVYMTGITTSNNFPTTPAAFQPTAAGQHAFVVKIGFPIMLPAPKITDYSPGPLLANNTTFTLRIFGQFFLNGAVVNWNGSPLVTTFVSAGKLTAVVPGALVATTGSALLSVTNPDGRQSGTVTATIINPVPALAFFNPTSANAGGPNTMLLVTGSSFLPSSVVNWNGNPLTTVYLSANQLTVNLPASFITSMGVRQITVTNPTPGGGTSGAKPFTVNLTSITWNLVSITRNTTTNQIFAKIKIVNSGYITAPAVTVTKAALGVAMSTSTLPTLVGNIASGGSVAATLTFPGSAGATGITVQMGLAGVFTGGSFLVMHPVKLP